MLKLSTLLMASLLIVGCNSDTSTSSAKTQNNSQLYYGDIQNDRVLVIDINTMSLEKTIDNTGQYPYEVTQLNAKQFVAINRKDYTLNIIEDKEIVKSIDLDFKPRSFVTNTKRTLISSVSEPSELLFSENFTSSKKYSDSAYTTPKSYGGSYATGHPYWINESYFLLLDRCENAVELYSVDDTAPIDKLLTTTSVHHVVYVDKTYYGLMEGSTTKALGVVKFKIEFGKIKYVGERLMSDFSDTNVSLMGGHHLAMHPDGKHLYVPSKEGVVYVLNSEDLSLVRTLKTGKGAGHILFSRVEDKVYMITTNHKDVYKSIFDVTDATKSVKLKDIYFDTKASEGITTQSHTTHVIGTNLYFMYNDANSSKLIEMSLKDLNVSRELVVPNNYSLMGAISNSFVETNDM